MDIQIFMDPTFAGPITNSDYLCRHGGKNCFMQSQVYHINPLTP